MKKVIFLDIDGVLNIQDWQSRRMDDTPKDEFGWEFDPVAVENLAYIIKETGAAVVISSSWKFLGMSKLKEMWKIRDLPGELLDITPNTVSDEKLLNTNLDETELSRGDEIKEWLSKHKREVSNYVIIDDFDDMLPEQEDHVVLTNTLIGITKFDAEKAIAILKKM